MKFTYLEMTNEAHPQYNSFSWGVNLFKRN